MKKNILTIAALLLLTLTASADNVMKKEADGTYVVNTTTLCKTRGYKGTTPLEVHIKNGKVGYTIYDYDSHGKKCYSIHWVDK